MPREVAHRAQPKSPAPRPRCVTFPNRFSKTYKRISPKLSVPVRAYTGLISLCPISRNTTKNHPKREPPQHMPATTLAIVQSRVTHLMSPSILQDLRASTALDFTLDPLAPFSAFCHLRFVAPARGLAAACRLAHGAERSGLAHGAERSGLAHGAERSGLAHGAERSGLAHGAERSGLAHGAKRSGLAKDHQQSRRKGDDRVPMYNSRKLTPGATPCPRK